MGFHIPITIKSNISFQMIAGSSQPRSQGLSSSRLGEKLRDPVNEVGLKFVFLKNSYEICFVFVPHN